jgi:hypothetical protein
MSESQKNTAFLKRAIRFDGTEECRALEEKIIQVQLETRCVKRAMVLLALCVALVGARFAYGLILQENFPDGEHRTIVRIIYAVGLSSFLSLGAFSVLLLVYRLKLDRLREDCRRLVTKRLERHPQGADGRKVAQDTPPRGCSESDHCRESGHPRTPPGTEVRCP